MRVLLIEDNKEINRFLKENLEAQSFIVDAAEDGETGISLAGTNNYDVIVLDNVLPKKQGQQVCEELRKKNILTPILILSVKSEVTTKVNLLNSGADDYLTKPFSLEELLCRIRALLRRPHMVQNEIYKIDDLVVNTKIQSVKRNGQEIYLRKKEFMLLEYLIKNKGTVLSRGLILENVWDMNADPFSNTIESHILNLRKKIDGESKVKLIHTISGRGYKIDKIQSD